MIVRQDCMVFDGDRARRRLRGRAIARPTHTKPSDRTTGDCFVP